MRSLAFILLSISALAQGLEIRGTVLEYGSNAPIDGAEVTIKEFVLVDNFVTPKVIAQVLTNARGEYLYRPEHVANFFVESRKTGYEDATSGKLRAAANSEAPVSLTADRPAAPVPALILVRPGEMSGKVVDGDGKPRASQLLMIRGQHTPIWDRVTTDSAGEFRVPSMEPGQYLIRIAPTEMGWPDVIPYSDAEAEKIDEGVESGYWPGGATGPSRALPVQVEPGSRINVGSLVVRTLKYPRLHVTVEGDCSGTWGFTFTAGRWVNDGPGFTARPCQRDMLLKFVPPGGGIMHIADLKSKRWGSVELTDDRRRPAVLRILDPIDIPVRMLPPEGMSLASIGKIQVNVVPADSSLLLGNQGTVESDAAGRATILAVPWAAHRVSVQLLSPDLYVKTIRYYGSPLSGPVFENVGGATLEVELDNRAPTLAGTVPISREATNLLLVRWPAMNELDFRLAPPFQYTRVVNGDGKYTLQLAPGEYRAIAITESRTRSISSAELRALLASGERVVLERGEEKTLDVKSVAR